MIQSAPFNYFHPFSVYIDSIVCAIYKYLETQKNLTIQRNLKAQKDLVKKNYPGVNSNGVMLNNEGQFNSVQSCAHFLKSISFQTHNIIKSIL